MPPVGFEPTISAGERPQTYTLYRAATAPYIYIYIYTYTHTYTYTHIQLHVFGLKRKILGRRLAVCLWPGVPIGWQDGCNLLTLFSLSFGNNRVL